MKKTRYSIVLMLVLAFCFSSLSTADVYAQEAKESHMVVSVFHSPHCSSCIKVLRSIIPQLIKKYGKEVEWDFYNIDLAQDYRLFLELEDVSGRNLGTPLVVVGNVMFLGVNEISDSLDKEIDSQLKNEHKHETIKLTGKDINILDHFKSFGSMAVIGAGLVDGFNPCAFTVIVFFVSFLTVMGYKTREMVIIGIAYIFAVFATYLGMGLGIFQAVYRLKFFYEISKFVYMGIGGLSLFLGCLAIKDYFIFKQTGKTDAMALQLPKVVKNKIHSIVGNYYRKDKTSKTRAMAGLIVSALIVGFLISLLEAVCTGQLYLPTIVFVLKEGTLRARALWYLIAYNLMFILPLVVVLVLAIGGVTSRQFESFARRHLGFVKLVMAAVFFALGVVLWVGII